MKALYMLTLSALCLIPAIAGTAVLANEAAPAYQSMGITSLDLLKAQASSDAILSRPL
jgi:hypothetical protein